MLTAHGLRKSYGGVLALHDLSVTIRPGQTLGLLGPNGSGKSTTINMLTGLIRPSSGTVSWQGADIHDGLVAYQAILGYVPEEPRLYAYLSAPEYLRLVGGLRDIERAVPDLRQRPGTPAAIPIAYRPLAATAPTSTTLLVSTVGDAVSLAAPVREALRALDDLVPLHRARSLAAATRDATWAARVSAHLALTVSGSAFLLAAAGLYAVVSHRTSRRQREIGVRMALGADRRRVAALVLGSVGGALASGLVLGLAGVVAWARAFAPRGDATPLRPAMLAAGIAALVLTALAGGLLPMRRASRVAPAEVLRRE